MNRAFFSFLPVTNVRYENGRSGYPDLNFVLNCGSVFWFIVLYFIGFIFLKSTLFIFRSVKDTKIMSKLNNFFVYGFLISLLVEGYLELLFSSLIHIKGK